MFLIFDVSWLVGWNDDAHRSKRNYITGQQEILTGGHKRIRHEEVFVLGKFQVQIGTVLDFYT